VLRSTIELQELIETAREARLSYPDFLLFLSLETPSEPSGGERSALTERLGMAREIILTNFEEQDEQVDAGLDDEETDAEERPDEYSANERTVRRRRNEGLGLPFFDRGAEPYEGLAARAGLLSGAADWDDWPKVVGRSGKVTTPITRRRGSAS
jgi:hypothetical protein